MSSEANNTINRQAVLSLFLSMLTFALFCIGFLPIPLSALICYPFAVMLGLAALFTGARALYQIRRNGGQGRVLAWIGLISGGSALIAVLCFTTLAISLLPHLLDFFRQNFPAFKFPNT